MTTKQTITGDRPMTNQQTKPTIKPMPLWGKASLVILGLLTLIGQCSSPKGYDSEPSPLDSSAMESKAETVATNTKPKFANDLEAWEWADSGRLYPEPSQVAFENRTALMFALAADGKQEFENQVVGSCLSSGVELEVCEQEAKDLTSTLYRFANAEVE